MKGIEKIQEEKEKEIELKKKDAEDAINLARERKAKVCPFESCIMFDSQNRVCTAIAFIF